TSYAEADLLDNEPRYTNNQVLDYPRFPLALSLLFPKKYSFEKYYLQPFWQLDNLGVLLHSYCQWLSSFINLQYHISFSM
ncbi:MAG: hypothetical protein LBR46_05420, partial [Prevotella sp.]|nr:hypothetical protein [Prevotella sp.]